MRSWASILLLLLSFFHLPCLASKLDLHSTKPLVIPRDNVTPRLTSKDVAEIIPTNIPKDESTASMMNRIADRTFMRWFNSPSVRDSAFGRFATQTEENLKTDVVVEGEAPEDISHKFSVRIEAFQACAKLMYSGWLNAAVNYDAKASQADVQITEKVLHDKDLTLSHKNNSDQGLSMIGLAWSW